MLEREKEGGGAAEKTILANIYESFFVFQLSLVEKPFHLYLLIIFSTVMPDLTAKRETRKFLFLMFSEQKKKLSEIIREREKGKYSFAVL